MFHSRAPSTLYCTRQMHQFEAKKESMVINYSCITLVTIFSICSIQHDFYFFSSLLIPRFLVFSYIFSFVDFFYIQLYSF